MAAQREFLEHANPSDVDDLAKFVLLHEKELGSRVAEICKNIEKSVCHDILSHLGNEAILPLPLKRHTRGTYYFSIIYSFNNLSLYLIFLLPPKVFSNKLLLFYSYTCYNYNA